VPEGVLPRIIARKPAPGDIHPLRKRAIGGLFARIPPEYLYGLSRVELRARQTKAIGKPFGCYRRDEKVIILYSVPPVIWHFPSLLADFRRSLTACYAVVASDEEGIRVTWPEDALISLWYYAHVLTHELGHHYVEQYRVKSGRLGGTLFAEFVAEMHARRLTADFFRAHRESKDAA
jgi:hypothetical protein